MNNFYKKNPYDNQYVADYGFHFVDSKGNNLGKIIWINNVEGIMIEKDTENDYIN